MKRILLLCTTAILVMGAQAHEGMWLLSKLKEINEAEMQKLGFKLSAEDIYDINRSGVKDAVVRLGGGFCSGEMVSAEGLFLTNHHCGYEAVQGLSSVEHDYLTDGFWAMTRKDELPAGFNVSFLQRIDDVSATVLAELNDGMSEADRQAKVAEVGQRLEKEAADASKGISASLKTMFEGNEFYLFVYKTDRVVRLVGVPPSAIGKFGGDTDNWMWPRHTGDFCMFRVYTGPDGEPADYNEANIPFKPKWHFPVSIAGVKEGDFAMIMGYPGSTDRFLSSHGVKLALDIEQPSREDPREEARADEAGHGRQRQGAHPVRQQVRQHQRFVCFCEWGACRMILLSFAAQKTYGVVVLVNPGGRRFRACWQAVPTWWRGMMARLEDLPRRKNSRH